MDTRSHVATVNPQGARTFGSVCARSSVPMLCSCMHVHRSFARCVFQQLWPPRHVCEMTTRCTQVRQSGVTHGDATTRACSCVRPSCTHTRCRHAHACDTHSIRSVHVWLFGQEFCVCVCICTPGVPPALTLAENVCGAVALLKTTIDAYHCVPREGHRPVRPRHPETTRIPALIKW